MPAADAGGPLELLFRDDRLAVVNKPAGLMVHDSQLAGDETEFLADRLRAQLAQPIFLVHRLDRATSGALLVAFDRDTASRLGRLLMACEGATWGPHAASATATADARAGMPTVGITACPLTSPGHAASGEVGSEQAASEPAASEPAAFEKDYWAVCRGWPPEAFVVDHPLDGGPGKPRRKPALTRFTRLGTCELALPAAGFATSRYAWLCAQPQTGRFRQIRRHLKHASHHLIGDTSHGDGRHNRHFRMLGIHRMLLHARRLAFTHPHTGARIDVTAPVDAAFAKALALFGGHPPRGS